ncbi:threonylcarbamoyl-AMP synthase [Haloferax mediterranei ATCC 33500]|uniref:L-threonylcarbamoyladenylate synthase n=1 Tax=Haloferax mediterranei (strain ATCC 33500 / DSM 1411 / JCM 8866 / NBRC 14739 / NCIMB 2177 / R-4) TaxID=523841 RepID=I3R189_HALMT|nr:L-threonylcarbamoyladenylate synthase [Haloferax mediterranei]AFK17999.1 DNA binding protein, translation factor [Haloferax mediterranei ATCC 33500]AHZ22582.1 DNA-binding protein [Haloferax mediterranei ATCC 33500]EMA02725.1 DNA binding protein, translation factor [Haloferax mediterranei ATCC 33500]MDX5988091.1 L-threonylcarbamoyladenylate synthase [Haloferax mediterranei ATCC 33500]QCQ74544.1 threonylcarbamoyl-AMP synthase [Haloferax mediterranei ATCC 33500]
MSDDDVKQAADAIRRGEAVVYPTETVYGMGADATNPDAIERVFDIKGRDRDKPLSAGFPDVDAALEYVVVDDREVAFMRRFLPGPVTVVVERRDSLPDVLVSGRDRVGVRVPDHDLALDFFEQAGTPVTATSANRSGTGSITNPSQLSDEIREAVAFVLDGGTTPGTESTVVDPGRGIIHRRGAMADEIEAWLETHADSEPEA